MAILSGNTKSQETRALGWYAVRWLNVTDWFKAYKSRSKKLRPTGPLAMPELKSANQSGDQELKAEDKLKEVVEESQSILVQARAMAPFQLFPDVITIDRHKLTIVYRRFFNVGQTVSVPIENIKNIQADLSLLFGSLTVTSDHFINNTQTITHLARADVTRIQKLIQGAMVAVKEGIDITKIETKQLCDMLIDLGEGHTGILQT